jgi:hypothetical protein
MFLELLQDNGIEVSEDIGQSAGHALIHTKFVEHGSPPLPNDWIEYLSEGASKWDRHNSYIPRQTGPTCCAVAGIAELFYTIVCASDPPTMFTDPSRLRCSRTVAAVGVMLW